MEFKYFCYDEVEGESYYKIGLYENGQRIKDIVVMKDIVKVEQICNSLNETIMMITDTAK